MPKAVWVLALNNFFVSLGFGVMMPVLPVFARSFQVSTFMVSWVVSGFALMRMLMSPWCGRLINLFGERTVLGTGIFIVATSSAAAAFATSFWQLLVFRGLGGLGSAMFAVSAMTLLMRMAPVDSRGRATGLYQSGFVIGGMAGPAVGGIVSKISLGAPFLFYAATLTVGGILVLALIRSDPDRRNLTAAQRQGMTLAQAWADVRYRGACASGFAQGWQSMGARSVLLALMVTEVLHMGREWTGYVTAVAAVAQALFLALIGRLTDTWGRRPVLLVGLATAFVLNFFTPFAPTIGWMMILVPLYALGASCIATSATASVGDVAGPRGGTPIAMYSMAQDIGVILGPLAAGLLVDNLGMRWGFWGGSLLFVLASTVASRMPPGAPRKPDADVIAVIQAEEMHNEAEL